MSWVGRAQEIDAGGTDGATGRRHQPHDRVAERRLAHAVAADHGEHALIERQRYALQRMGVAVVDLQVGHRERRPGGSMHGGLSHDARPDRYAARRGRADLRGRAVLEDLGVVHDASRARPRAGRRRGRAR